MHIVYLAINVVSGGQYVGMSNRSLGQRRNEHISASLSGRDTCRIFHAAIRKYGADSFVWSVIAEYERREDAVAREIAEIAGRKARYNITAGGPGVIAPRTKEWRERISAAHRGRRPPDHVIAALRNAPRKTKPVICIEDRQAFPSIKAAAAHYGVNAHKVTAAVHRHSGAVTAAGRHFALGDHVPSEEECARLIASMHPPRKPRAKKPAPPKTVRTAEQIESTRLSRVAKLKARRHPPETIDRMRAAAKIRGVARPTREARIERQRKHVVCVETGTVFRDAGEAAIAHGVKRSHVYDRLYYGRPSPQAGVLFRHAMPHEVGMMNVREAV